MALSIKCAEADRLARELAALTGESLTAAVTVALQERLETETRRRDGAKRASLRAKLRQIREEFARAPVLDPRGPDKILGHDDRGTFG